MALLEIDGLVAGYGALNVVHDVTLSVNDGEVVTLVGANGAGKTTMMRAIMGTADVRSGAINVAGRDLRGVNAFGLRRAGIGYAPQGRHLFPALSVRDNLQLGVYAVERSKRNEVFRSQLETVCSLFPAIPTFLDRSAGSLSGGQQQMVTLARALMNRPRLMLLDEPSMGLAPAPLRTILGAVSALRAEGVATLLVEQVASLSLALADRAYVLRGGSVVDHDDAASFIRDAERLRNAYFGDRT